MPRFVILRHDHPTLHWDFMLQAGDVLKTWRLEAPPEDGRAVPAEASFDHRLVYVDYEGEVSGGRGRVSAWDRGEFEEGPGSVEGRRVLLLSGRRVQGAVVLNHEGGGRWTVTLRAGDVSSPAG